MICRFGCGWGSLSLHAAERFGASVLGVTISREQKAFIDRRVAERGLSGRVEIRLQDYRDVPVRDRFDAVGSIEMGEHVGEANYPSYVEVLRRSVRPGGRVLGQQMSRAGKHPFGGPFIESFLESFIGPRHAHATGGGDRRSTILARGDGCSLSPGQRVRTTSTGLVDRRRRSMVTEPRALLLKPPRPRLPTTTTLAPLLRRSDGPCRCTSLMPGRWWSRRWPSPGWRMAR